MKNKWSEAFVFTILIIIFGTCFILSMYFTNSRSGEFDKSDMTIICSLAATTFFSSLTTLITYFKFIRKHEKEMKMLDIEFLKAKNKEVNHER